MSIEEERNAWVAQTLGVKKVARRDVTDFYDPDDPNESMVGFFDPGDDGRQTLIQGEPPFYEFVVPRQFHVDLS